MVSQKTYAWKLPKRFRTKGFVINFFRTLQYRLYIKSFATNFITISRKNSVLPFLRLLSPLLGFPSHLLLSLFLHSLCSLYSFYLLYSVYSLYSLYSSSLSPYPMISLSPCTPTTSLTLFTSFTSLSLRGSQRSKRVKGVKGVQGDREIIGYGDSEEE